MALTFATLLAVIPLLAILFSLFQLFGWGDWFIKILGSALTNDWTPGGSPQLARRIETLIQAFGGRTTGTLGLILLVLGLYGIFAAIESTFNLIWGVSAKPRALRRLPRYYLLIAVISLLVIGSLAITTYLSAIPVLNRMMQRVDLPVNLINRLLPGAMVMVSLFLLYRFLPAARVRTYAAAVGTAVAGLLYEAVKHLFIFYTGRLVRYDLFYGSLAFVPLLIQGYSRRLTEGPSKVLPWRQ
jgi:membrane protein